jgi:hypothetical protein
MRVLVIPVILPHTVLLCSRCSAVIPQPQAVQGQEFQFRKESQGRFLGRNIFNPGLGGLLAGLANDWL